jgi:hypothetical protein
MSELNVTMFNYHHSARTHDNSGLVSLTTLPAVIENKITSGIFIEALRVDPHGLTKQALWLTDETFAALLLLIADYTTELAKYDETQKDEPKSSDNS